MTQSNEVVGACPHDCPDTCSLVTTVQDGRAVRVRGNPAHPPTDGVLCTKVSRYAERTHHPERILTPLRRAGAKGEGRFEPIGWDAALHEIASRLTAIAARNPQAILPYSYAGTMGLVQGESMDRRLFHQLGASLLDRTICATAGGEALTRTLGGKVGMRVEFFAEARLILIWGSNSIASNLHFWRLAQQARRAGARLVCIDPRRTETADKCDEHIALLPGTDGALALGLMHQLIVNDWLDHDYIARHTLGWPALKERAMLWNPQRVAQVCGVPEAQIIELARAYGTTQPAAIRVNYGLQRCAGGGNAMRAVACLPALTGAWRHPAGGMQLSSSGSFPVNRKALQRPDLLKGTPRTINMSTIGDDLLKESSIEFGPQVEAVIVYNSNPLAVAPDSSKVAQGFAREDLFTVVLEHFQTDTVDYADIVLPATTQLEHIDAHSTYGHLYMMANNAAVAPLGEAKANTEIFRLLAQYMGFDDPCFQESDDALAAKAFDATDARAVHFDWESLKRTGWQKLAMPEAPFAEGGFPTPSGKCEFYSSAMAQAGLDPLPTYIAPHESLASNPALAARFPLAMISPPARNFLNSTFVNVKSLRAAEGEPHLDIHPDDGAARGIAAGDMVRIFNDRGSFVAKARVTDKARKGLVVGLSVWWKKLASDGKNANEVTSQRLTDMGRAPSFYDCAVEVERMAG